MTFKTVAYVLANSLGAGPYPPEDLAEWSIICGPAADLMSATRDYEARLQNLPTKITDDINRYDPEGTALVFLSSLYSLERIAERAVFAYPRPEWVKLEDKVVIDALWDAVGVARAPSRVVPVSTKELRLAVQQLEGVLGTVWAGDAREGYNAGASYTRWVKTEEDFLDAERFFSAHCDRVRIMPFLAGVPCSMHGIVFPEGVTIFRPVELVIFRVSKKGRLMYAGNGTFWDPPQEDRNYMRQVSRHVAQFLRKEVAYRGAFNIDGVLTSTGFLPTELNARYGAALNTIAQSLPGMPLSFVDMAARRDEPLQYCPEALEDMVVTAADLNRNGVGGALTETTWENVIEHPLVLNGNRFRIGQAEEPPAAWVTLGKSQVGGVVRIRLNPTQTPVGEPIAPLVAKVFALADEEFGTSFGEFALLPASA